MDHTFVSALILLLLVLDPLGSLPIFIAVMRSLDPARRTRVALREALIAFSALLAFLLGGEYFLRVMHLSERSLEVAGGVILLLIAVRMIFGGSAGFYSGHDDGREPMIFPLAVPLLAGPSAMATVLLLASRQPEHLWRWAAALTVAMVISTLVLLASDQLHRRLGDSAVSAMEKLMGLVLSAIAVEMLLSGVKRYFFG